ncbi:unnamed protein product [Adineta ricciae]|uniref:Uncharacterized protein n=1 Tax=Adineta ricciae TaxID=249248 RepID=A0A813R3Y8_ADIRI|nr:unnamed protein product [Adineta ricciae]
MKQASGGHENETEKQQSHLAKVGRWCTNLCQQDRSDDDEPNQQEDVNLNTFMQTIRSEELPTKLFPLKHLYTRARMLDKNSVALACNSQYILVKQRPYLRLLNKQLSIVKEIPWTYEFVEMCWSLTLRKFFLITEKIIFTLNDFDLRLDQCKISCDNNTQWTYGACSTTHLYLSTGDMFTCVYEYTLQPSIEFVKEWKIDRLHPQYEGILNYICANDQLAMIISNTHMLQRRFEVHSLATYERLWSIRLNAVARCCSIFGNQWMVMELLNPRLLHVSSDGKILQEHQMKSTPEETVWNALQVDKNIILTFTMANLNVYKLW